MAFAKSLDEEADAALFLYATQQPHEAHFLLLKRENTALPYAVRDWTLEEAYQTTSSVHRHVYRMVEGRYATSRELPVAGDLLVIPDLAFGDGCLVSEGFYSTMEEVLGELPTLPARQPTPAANGAPKAPPPPAATVAAFLAERPHLAEYFNDATAPGFHGAGAGAVGAAGAAAGPDAELGEGRGHLLPEELEAIWAELHEKKKEFDTDAASGDDFRVRVRGGRMDCTRERDRR
jgi:hypothetical protein